LAKLYSDEPIEDRIEAFLVAEKELIESEDTEFRFHSGIPVAI
jgi:tRNA-(ms[2]io[6]A)-hydroxylase